MLVFGINQLIYCCLLWTELNIVSVQIVNLLKSFHDKNNESWIYFSCTATLLDQVVVNLCSQIKTELAVWKLSEENKFIYLFTLSLEQFSIVRLRRFELPVAPILLQSEVWERDRVLEFLRKQASSIIQPQILHSGTCNPISNQKFIRTVRHCKIPTEKVKNLQMT